MARTVDDVELYLRSLDRQYVRDGEAFVLASGLEETSIGLLVHDPLVLVRVDIGTAPTDSVRQVALFRRLLELNGEDLIHSSYSLEGDQISLGAGLRLENLDMNEVASVLSEVDLALARHAQPLRALARG